VPPPAEQLNAQLEGFEVLGLIGHGGMGAVYKAIHLRLDRVVAIKVLPPELAASDPAFGERFLREARALAKLQHPNLVVVYDFGEASGLFFIVMEYVEGPTLRQLIHSKSLSPERTLQILPQICSGLRYAHSQGLVHRDIKPDNILIGDDGRVRITDFGLARLVNPSPLDISLTQSTHTLGTPHYMAPEQLRNPENVDHRADIFALGVVFYEMLTGHLPQGRFAMPSAEAPVGKHVDEVVLRSLEPNPEQRFQQVNEVQEALEQPGVSSEHHADVGTGKESAQNRIGSQKPDLTAGPLFPEKKLAKQDLNTETRTIRMKAFNYGLFITLASLLPWGGMETNDGIIYPALVWGGYFNFFGVYLPLWLMPAAGISISSIVGFRLIRNVAKRWRTLQQISNVGFYLCIYAFMYFFIVYVDGPHSTQAVFTTLDGGEFPVYSHSSGNPMPGPGFGAVVTGILFFYARHYFKKMRTLAERLVQYEKRDLKRRRKANKSEQGF
jgi:predicted Ser/Thr protein kinase